MDKARGWQVCAKPMGERRIRFEEEHERNASFALCPACLLILPVAWFVFRYLKKARKDVLALIAQTHWVNCLRS